ncbi:MAG: DUF4349 domain-containing protein [Cyanobacteria bacterium]|nr:DUF4349 domain-containing protein [Cyanobacteriota bacterium]
MNPPIFIKNLSVLFTNHFKRIFPQGNFPGHFPFTFPVHGLSLWPKAMGQRQWGALMCVCLAASLTVSSLTLSGCSQKLRTQQQDERTSNTVPQEIQAPSQEGYMGNGKKSRSSAEDAEGMAVPEPSDAASEQPNTLEADDRNTLSQSQISKPVLDDKKGVNHPGAQLFKPQIIKTATVTLRVENIEKAMKGFDQLVNRYQGIITNQSMTIASEGSNYRGGRLEVRIPQDQLENFLNEVPTHAKVLSQEITGEDVGAEIVDQEARIRNLQAQEAALQVIMKRTGKIIEVLEVSKELGRVRGEIEEAQSRVAYLKQQVAYSTVTLTLSENTLSTPESTKTGWDTLLSNAFKNALNALDDLLRGILTLGVWLGVYGLPILLILAAVLSGMGWILKGFWCLLFRKTSKQPFQDPSLAGTCPESTSENNGEGLNQ